MTDLDLRFSMFLGVDGRPLNGNQIRDGVAWHLTAVDREGYVTQIPATKLTEKAAMEIARVFDESLGQNGRLTAVAQTKVSNVNAELRRRVADQLQRARAVAETIPELEARLADLDAQREETIADA